MKYKTLLSLLLSFCFIYISCAPNKNKSTFDVNSKMGVVNPQDSNATYLCSFKFEKTDMDVDYTAFVGYGDSSTYEIESWTKTEYLQLLSEYKMYCQKDHSDDSPDYHANELFDEKSTLMVEVNEIFRYNEDYEKTVVIHGNDAYCIISYGN